MITYYNIAGLNVQIKHANDELFRFIHDELKIYETLIPTIGDILIQLNPNNCSVPLPDQAIMTSNQDGEIRFTKDEQSFILIPSIIFASQDYNNRRITINYISSYDAVKNITRAAIKWMIIKSAEKLGFTYIHGAAITLDDRNIFFIGDSGCGKSSFLFRLNNTSIITDDTILIKNNHIYPYCLKPSIKKNHRFPVTKLNNIALKKITLTDNDIIIFSKIWNSTKNKIRKLEKNEALSNLLNIYHNEIAWCSRAIDDNLLIERYDKLSKIKSYEFIAGNDEKEIKIALEKLIEDDKL